MSWTCDGTRDCLREQATLPSAAVEHIAGCALCQDIIGMVSFDPLVPPESASSVPDMAQLLADTQSCLANERGVVAWLRSRPNTLQIAIGFIATILPAVGILALARRIDLGSYPTWRLVAFILALAFAAVVVLRMMLAPLYRFTASGREAWILVVAFGVPFALAALAPAHTAHVPAEGASAAVIVAQAFACQRLGVIVAVPTLMFLLVMDRVHGVRRKSVVAAAAVGGICGNLALLFHCSNEARVHRLLGHAVVGLLLLVLGAAAVYVRKIRVRPAP